MSNNSWKQYGGISKMDDFNVINASTIIAEQFVSRSTKPIYQYLNGIFEVSYDLSAGQNVIASNSIYAAVDLFINKDIYSNNKIFLEEIHLLRLVTYFQLYPMKQHTHLCMEIL